jgi:hypothetical protein
MIKLDLGNVLLKPSQRKQLMGWLRRALRLGERVGNFVLIIRMQRKGRNIDVRANVHDSAGDFGVHTRQQDWRSALRKMVWILSTKLHDQLRMTRLAT